MKRMVRGLLAGALALLSWPLGAPGASSADEPSVVSVEGGRVRGTTAGDVTAYKGIPYAQPPVGALRWRAPQPARPWKEARDASDYGCDCPQVELATDRPRTVGLSEDCLFVNVWRPAASASRRLPVLVWIHGGGLVRGGSSQYPGEGLARQGLVVVSLNYRLGRLGFFAHPALAAEAPNELRGNYGFMDQLAALQWVKRNIAAFGGDPEEVTLAGESAGGGSVLTLLTSPMAKGLFRRAILQSPGLPTLREQVIPLRGLGAAEAIALAYAGSLGIEGRDASALSALRALPVSTLVAGAVMPNLRAELAGGPPAPGLAGPILDGRLVAEAPDAVMRSGRQAKVPVLVGANDHDLAAGQARSKDELFAGFGPLAEQARALYDPQGQASLEALVQAVYADRTMLEPARHFADQAARAGQPSYLYRFSYVPESLRGRMPGALHGGEIAFAFDALPVWLGALPFWFGARETPTDRAMARTTSAYWVAFARTGDPNGPGRPAWPRHVAGSRQVLNFTAGGVRAEPDPAAARLDLWRAVWEQGR